MPAPVISYSRPGDILFPPRWDFMIAPVRFHFSPVKCRPTPEPRWELSWSPGSLTQGTKYIGNRGKNIIIQTEIANPLPFSIWLLQNILSEIVVWGTVESSVAYFWESIFLYKWTILNSTNIFPVFRSVRLCILAVRNCNKRRNPHIFPAISVKAP